MVDNSGSEEIVKTDQSVQATELSGSNGSEVAQTTENDTSADTGLTENESVKCSSGPVEVPVDDLKDTDTTNPTIYNKLQQFIESQSHRAKTHESITKDDLSAADEALTENKAGIPSFSSKRST